MIINMKSVYNTPDIKRKADSNLSTGLWQEQETTFIASEGKDNINVSNGSFNFHISDLKIGVPCQRNLVVRARKEEKARKRKLLKQVLNGMVLSKFFRIKVGFNKIKQIPQKQNRKQFSSIHSIAEQLIYKTPITAQTALLRSILNLRKSNTLNNSKPQQNKNKILKHNNISLINLNHSIIIYPCELIQNRSLQKKAILILQQFANQKIKKIISCFRKNSFNCNYIKNYFKKVINNYRQNQFNFLRKLRVITKIHRESIIDTKRKHLQSLLNSCMQRRDKIIIENLKLNYQRAQMEKLLCLELIGRSEQYRKLGAFFAIYRYAVRKEMKNPEDIVDNLKEGKLQRHPLENSRIIKLRKHIQSLKRETK